MQDARALTRVASNIGKAIAAARKQTGKTQSEMADAIHVATSTISQIERGQRLPSLVMLERIADALRVSLVKLIGLAELIEQSTDPDLLRELAKALELVSAKSEASTEGKQAVIA